MEKKEKVVERRKGELIDEEKKRVVTGKEASYIPLAFRKRWKAFRWYKEKLRKESVGTRDYGNVYGSGSGNGSGNRYGSVTWWKKPLQGKNHVAREDGKLENVRLTCTFDSCEDEFFTSPPLLKKSLSQRLVGYLAILSWALGSSAVRSIMAWLSTIEADDPCWWMLSVVGSCRDAMYNHCLFWTVLKRSLASILWITLIIVRHIVDRRWIFVIPNV